MMKSRKHINPADFVAFLECKLIEWEDAAAPGDIDAAVRIETLRRILGRTRAPPPKPRPGRPTLVYSRKAPLERAPADLASAMMLGSEGEPPPMTMTTNPTPLARAIARHKAAQAAVDAPDPEDCPEHLRDEENKALDELAFTPCTNDAEFLEKLRYLYAQQAKIWDLPDNGDDYGCIVIAAACHFCPVNA